MKNYMTISDIKRRVLIVDDELINRELLGIVLQEDYDILFAETGTQALAAVNEHSDSLSLILLDLNLPDMHGLDIIRELKSNPISGKIPIIVLTSEKDAEVESLTIGASDFIPKPIVPAVLEGRISRIMELEELIT